ncbi:hypothetical protein ARSEF1564_010338 [Beauveria bassiana]
MAQQLYLARLGVNLIRHLDPRRKDVCKAGGGRRNGRYQAVMQALNPGNYGRHFSFNLGGCEDPGHLLRKHVGGLLSHSLFSRPQPFPPRVVQIEKRAATYGGDGGKIHPTRLRYRRVQTSKSPRGIEPAGAGAGAHGEVEQTKPLNFKATLTGMPGGEEG